MNFVINVIIGIIIGTAMILPGISGGVLAVILGIYDKMLKALSNIFKDFKKNFLFLLPYIIGGIVGVLLFSKILQFLFNKYPIPTQFTFLGFIIGGIPALGLHIKNNNGKINIPAYLCAFIFALILFIMDANNIFGTIQSTNIINISDIRLFISGILFAIGTIIPGISNFQLLFLIGTYNAFLNAIASFANPSTIDMAIIFKLIPMILGFVVGAIILVKLLSHLIEKYYAISYSAIIGFVVGSIPVIYPGFKLNIESIFGVILMIVGFFVSYKLSTMRKE